MQTFLPYESFAMSAACLDRARLGKQRVETLQILKALILPDYGWKSHPAVRMWEGCAQTLIYYGICVCREWIARGYKDTCLEKILAFENCTRPVDPWWLGEKAFHNSHKSKLLQKKPEHYNQYNWDVPQDLDYWWPTKNNLTMPESVV
jgi:hypothetical protein